MENSKEFNEIAYKKAQKRVKDTKTYYYFVLGYLFVGGIIFYKNYNGNIFDISSHYAVWMVILWGVFIAFYGIYIFVPFFYNWEQKEINKQLNRNK